MVIGLARATEGEGGHLINKDIVANIKTKTKSWTPYEADEHPFKDEPMELMRKRFSGNLGYKHSETWIEQLKKLNLGFIDHLFP